MFRTATLLVTCALAFALPACSFVSRTVPATETPTTGVFTVDWPDLGVGAARYITIELGPDSLETCRRTTAKFPFDSTSARAQDRAELSALGRRLNHTEMLSRNVLLVGRADAQGSADYNKGLGCRRADRIKELLMRDGLAADRIKVSSAGETGAMGDKPEYSHGHDRRVDIVITGGSHAP